MFSLGFPLAFVVLLVGENLFYVHDPGTKCDEGDQPVAIFRDIEYSSFTHEIRVMKLSPDVDMIAPVNCPDSTLPVTESCGCIRMFIAELFDATFANDPHSPLMFPNREARVKWAFRSV